MRRLLLRDGQAHGYRRQAAGREPIYGRFHGCNSMAHDTHARYLLKKEVAELEKTGWCRVWGKKSKPQWTLGLSFSLRLSPEQKMWLDRNGYIVEDWD